MTKEYVSTQRYKAFYWDGSNIEALQEWLKELGVSGSIWVDSFGRRQPKGLFLNKDGERQGVLTKHPEYVVVSTTFDVTVDVHDVDTFNKFFVEVSVCGIEKLEIYGDTEVEQKTMTNGFSWIEVVE